MRLLKQFEIDFPYNIKLALDFIKSSQNADGGFGLKTDYKSDPLSTSLAILSLKLFLNQADKCINNAESYLINTQDVSGFWPAVDFIMPRIGETYKSKALTTAFVLKALC